MSSEASLACSKVAPKVKNASVSGRKTQALVRPWPRRTVYGVLHGYTASCRYDVQTLTCYHAPVAKSGSAFRAAAIPLDRLLVHSKTPTYFRSRPASLERP